MASSKGSSSGPTQNTKETDMQFLSYFIELCMVTLNGISYIPFNYKDMKDILKRVFPWQTEYAIKQFGSAADFLYLPNFVNTSMEKGTVEQGSFYCSDSDIDLIFIPISICVVDEDTIGSDAIAVVESTNNDSYVKLLCNKKCSQKCTNNMLWERPESRSNSSPAKFYISSKEIMGQINNQMDEYLRSIAEPSLQMQSEVMEYHRLRLATSNRVFAFKNPVWPKVAEEWVYRKRPNNWPPESLVKEIQSFGSHVVAIGDTLSPDVDITWRLSFNVAEMRLADIMTLQQRKCLIAVKTFAKNANIDRISAYHLKCIMWWMIEQDEMTIWTEKDVGYCFLAFLNKIIETLKKGVIKNYFLPGCNMIQGVDQKELKEVILFFHGIRTNPLRAVVECENLTESLSNACLSFEERFRFSRLKDELLYFDGHCKAKTDLHKMFQFHFTILGTNLLRDPNMRENGIHYLRKAALLCNNLDVTEYTERVLFPIMEHYPKDEYVILAEILTVVPELRVIQSLVSLKHDYTTISVMFQNAGCIFHFWTKVRYKQKDKHQDFTLADKCFQTSINLCPGRPSAYAEYSYFLLIEERFAEALEHAEKALEKSQRNEQFENFNYLKRFRERLDPSLYCLMTKHHSNSDITMPSNVIAYHVCTSAKKKTGKTGQAIGVLNLYWSVCIDERNGQQYNSLTMYGYSCMELAMYEEALKAFNKAKSIQPNDILARHIEYCTKAMDAITCIVNG